MQEVRQQHLKKYCERHATNSTKLNLTRKQLWRLIVNDKHRVLYCAIPKVACTQWKWLFLALDNRTDVKDVHDPRNFKFLNQYSQEGIKLRLQTYFKFVFVREPFERLLSAYENKFVKGRLEWQPIRRYSKAIVDNFKRIDPNSDDTVTFTKFIYYVSGVGFNKERHWETYDNLCHPCDIHYDFIGHFDHMPVEAPYILRQTGMDRVVTFSEFLTHNTSRKLHEKYATIPKEKIAELAKAFQKDFDMFNFNFPGPFSDLMQNDSI